LRYFTVWRPKCLPDANWIIDDFYNRCIPIVSGVIVKDGISSNYQIVNIAIGESGNNDHFFIPGLRIAVEINQTNPARSGHCSVLGHVGHFDAQIAPALIEIQASGLKNSIRIGPVEIGERNKIVQKGI
jgi:hypothetical protein